MYALGYQVCAPRSMTSRPFLKGIWFHSPNLAKILLAALVVILMNWSGHNFARALTAQLSGRDMCKIVTWWDDQFSCKSITYFYETSIISS